MFRSLLPAAEPAEKPPDGIIEPVHRPLLERDDRVVGDGDLFRAHLGAALGDVAIAYPVQPPEVHCPVLGVQRMHLQGRKVHQEPGADEPLVEPVFAKHMADVLAQEALDALPELLHPVHVPLVHAPRPVRRVG
jgi:hypothetical protein